MKKDKREIIIDAAEKLMSIAPYSEISVDDIAKQAGIGKGSIYYYFKSKDDILYSLIEQSSMWQALRKIRSHRPITELSVRYPLWE